MRKIMVFVFFQENIEKCRKMKNDGKGSDIHKKWSHVMKNENNNIFCIFSGKYGKMSKKVRNDEKGVIYC